MINKLIKITLINIQSIMNEVEKLEAVISSDNPSVVFTPEHWLTEEASGSLSLKFNWLC